MRVTGIENLEDSQTMTMISSITERVIQRWSNIFVISSVLTRKVGDIPNEPDKKESEGDAISTPRLIIKNKLWNLLRISTRSSSRIYPQWHATAAPWHIPAGKSMSQD